MWSAMCNSCLDPREKNIHSWAYTCRQIQ
jgi:hypothetical protein